jgi:hypothetical protein
MTLPGNLCGKGAMDPPCKTLCEQPQSGFIFPALEDESINAYFPDPITGMNAVHHSDSRRNHGTTNLQSSAHNRAQRIPSREVLHNLVGLDKDMSACLSSTATASMHPLVRNNTHKQLLLVSALSNLLKPATHALPVTSTQNDRLPPPPLHGHSPLVSEPSLSPRHTYLAHQSVSAVRPRLHVDPRLIPADITAIIAAAAASMTDPHPTSAGVRQSPPTVAAAPAAASFSAAAEYASMPPPLPRVPPTGCGRCGQHGCGCGSARRRPRAVEPLSLGPGDPDRCRPAARRRKGE